MEKNFCPFIDGSCRSDCVFSIHKTATDKGEKNCIIFVGLNNTNPYQSDQLTEISQGIESITKR